MAPDMCLLLSVGRLAEGKGIEFLLQALPRLKREMKVPFKLLLVGTGPFKGELQRLTRELGLQQQVTFLGFRRDIGNLLLASDIVILPSLHEGLSISLLEAMAAGKPIVATAIGSNLEATRNGAAALLVPVKDSDAIATAVCKLANDADLRTWKAQRAKEIYYNHYTEKRMLESYRDQYLQLLSGAATRQRKPSLRLAAPVYRTEASS
jgi:glycosyltransferase involved in cell wall biosynthesis